MTERWLSARGARVRIGSAAVVIALAACGSDDDGGDGSGDRADGGGSSGRDAGADAGGQAARRSSAGLFGDFNLEFTPATPATEGTPAKPAVSSVLGIFSDRPTPPKIRLSLQAEVGDCKLFTPDVPFCSVNCVAMQAKCTDDDVCTPNPKPQNTGKAHFTAGSNELDIDFVATSYQLKAGVKLPYPACAEGEPVRVEVEGGQYEPFALQTRCIDLFDVDGPFPIERGKPLALTWSVPGDEELARIEIKIDVSHHGGGSKGEIRCDVADTGGFDVPAELMDQLVDLGFAGYPTVQLTRVATGRSDGDAANVTISVSMMQERAVTISGLVSCQSTDSDCPMGQHCQPDLTCM